MSIASLPAFRTYGRLHRQRAVQGWRVSISAHAANDTIPAHRHADEHVWCLSLAGAFEERWESQGEECAPGGLLIRPPACVHSNRFGSTAVRCLNLFPERDWLVHHGAGALTDTRTHQRSARLLRLGRELARELAEDDSASDFAVESLLAELVESAARLEAFARDGHARWFAAVLDEVEANPASELRLANLAACAGVSAGHLARTFRAAFGKSAGDYVRERRLHRAAATMRETARPLAEVAADVGFCDQAHFTRAFKAQFGTTPAHYRQTLRANARRPSVG